MYNNQNFPYKPKPKEEVKKSAGWKNKSQKTGEEYFSIFCPHCSAKLSMFPNKFKNGETSPDFSIILSRPSNPQ